MPEARESSIGMKCPMFKQYYAEVMNGTAGKKAKNMKKHKVKNGRK